MNGDPQHPRLIQAGRWFAVFWLVAGSLWLLCGIPCAAESIRVITSPGLYHYPDIEWTILVVLFIAIGVGIVHLITGRRLLGGTIAGWRFARKVAGGMCVTIILAPIYLLAFVKADRTLGEHDQ